MLRVFLVMSKLFTHLTDKSLGLNHFWEKYVSSQCIIRHRSSFWTIGDDKGQKDQKMFEVKIAINHNSIVIGAIHKGHPQNFTVFLVLLYLPSNIWTAYQKSFAHFCLISSILAIAHGLCDFLALPLTQSKYMKEQR